MAIADRLGPSHQDCLKLLVKVPVYIHPLFISYRYVFLPRVILASEAVDYAVSYPLGFILNVHLFQITVPNLFVCVHLKENRQARLV